MSFYRGVAIGTASRALTLLEFWPAGPIESTFQRVFLAPLLDYWSDHFPVADSRGFLWFQFGSTRTPSDRRPSAVILADVANWLTVAPFQPSNGDRSRGNSDRDYFQIAPGTISEGQNFPGGHTPRPPRWRASRETAPFSVVSEHPNR